MLGRGFLLTMLGVAVLGQAALAGDDAAGDRTGGPVPAGPGAATAPVGIGGRVEVRGAGFALTFPDGWLWADATTGDIERLGELLIAADAVRGPLLSQVLRGWPVEADPPDVHAVAPLPPGGRDLESCEAWADPPSGRPVEHRMAERAEAWSGLPGVTVSSTTLVDLPAGPAGRLDWVMLPADTEVGVPLDGSTYLLSGAGRDLRLLCIAPQAPPDRWESIAWTLELTPPTGPPSAEPSR